MPFVSKNGKCESSREQLRFANNKKKLKTIEKMSGNVFMSNIFVTIEGSNNRITFYFSSINDKFISARNNEITKHRFQQKTFTVNRYKIDTCNICVWIDEVNG